MFSLFSPNSNVVFIVATDFQIYQTKQGAPIALIIFVANTKRLSQSFEEEKEERRDRRAEGKQTREPEAEAAACSWSRRLPAAFGEGQAVCTGDEEDCGREALERRQEAITFMPVNAKGLFLILTPVLLVVIVITSLSQFELIFSPSEQVVAAAATSSSSSLSPSSSSSSLSSLSSLSSSPLGSESRSRNVVVALEPVIVGPHRHQLKPHHTTKIRATQTPDAKGKSKGTNTTTTTTAAAQKKKAQKRKQGQQVVDKQHYEKLEILLDRNSFILFNRCSTNRVYVRVNRRTRSGFIGARQQKMTSVLTSNDLQLQPDGSKRLVQRSRLDSAKIKLLSMIITVESVNVGDEKRKSKDTARRRDEGQLDEDAPADEASTHEQSIDVNRFQDDKQTSGSRQQIEASSSSYLTANNSRELTKTTTTTTTIRISEQTETTETDSKRKSNEVKLRANLTELYICFGQNGNIETRVNGRSKSCLFNELTLDHRHVKYQSRVNASWYIGFDQWGNPLAAGQQQTLTNLEPNVTVVGAALATTSGQLHNQSNDASTRSETGDGQLDAMADERCYQFVKLDRLTTSTQFFPEAMTLIRKEKELLSTNGNNNTNKTVSGTKKESERVFEEAQKVMLARRRERQNNRMSASLSPLGPLRSYSFNQSQIFNMTRFRNILRYQLGRTANQSILPEESGADLQPAAPQVHGVVTLVGRTRQQVSNKANTLGSSRRMARV